MGSRFNVPGEFPQSVVAIPRDDREALFLQANITGGPGSTVYRISGAGGFIETYGNPVRFEDGPLFIYMHPSLNVAYIPTSVPGNASASPYSNPNPKGKLRVLTPDANGNWAVDQPMFDLPAYAVRVATAPTGDFMIPSDAVGGTKQWELYMVKLDADGTPTAATAPLATFDATMVFDPRRGSRQEPRRRAGPRPLPRATARRGRRRGQGCTDPRPWRLPCAAARRGRRRGQGCTDPRPWALSSPRDLLSMVSWSATYDDPPIRGRWAPCASGSGAPLPTE